MKHVAVAILAGLALLAPPLRASADTTGSIWGSVRDTNGIPIADACIEARSPAQVERTTTDGRGDFVFLDLTPGTYTMTVSKPGYVVTSYPGLAVVPGAQTRAAIALNRALRIVARMIDRTPTALVDTYQTADLYQITSWNPMLANYPTIYNALQFVPGVLVGGGAGPQ